MSRERLERLRKLQRLRELEQERAGMLVRERQLQQAQASDEERATRERLEALAAGKRAADGQGLDLARYAQTLALEALGIDALVAAGERRRAADEAQREAIGRHGDAAAATEVAATRRRRVADVLRHEEEVRDMDRLADLRASQPEKRP